MDGRVRWLSLAGLIVALPGSGACSRAPEPCTTPGTCPKGEECLANRCVPYTLEPVSPSTRRTVLEPLEAAVISARSPRGNGGLRATAVFGSAAEGATALYLQFGVIPVEATPVGLALLLVSADAGSFGDTEEVEVEVWRIAQPWSAEQLSWTQQPKAALPLARGLGRGAPALPLRIDVTELARYWVAHPREALGLVVRAPSGTGHGASYSTGVLGGSAPRLEIYSPRGAPSQ